MKSQLVRAQWCLQLINHSQLQISLFLLHSHCFTWLAFCCLREFLFNYEKFFLGPIWWVFNTRECMARVALPGKPSGQQQAPHSWVCMDHAVQGGPLVPRVFLRSRLGGLGNGPRLLHQPEQQVQSIGLRPDSSSFAFLVKHKDLGF